MITANEVVLVYNLSTLALQGNDASHLTSYKHLDSYFGSSCHVLPNCQLYLCHVLFYYKDSDMNLSVDMKRNLHPFYYYSLINIHENSTLKVRKERENEKERK